MYVVVIIASFAAEFLLVGLQLLLFVKLSHCETVDPRHRRISDTVRTVSLVARPGRRLEVQRKTTIFEPKFYHDFRTMIVFRLRHPEILPCVAAFRVCRPLLYGIV